MKIAFFIEHISNGGAERVITNLANAFDVHGNSVVMITTLLRNDEYVLSPSIKRYITEGESYNSCRIIGPFKRLYRLRSILKKERPDYLVSFLNSALYHGVLTTRGLKTKSIISVRNDPNFDYSTLFKKVLAKIILPFSEGAVFQTQDAREWFPYRLQTKSTIIFNPIGESFYQAIYKPQNKKIVAVGRLTEQKDYIFLIESFSKFIESHNDWYLEIYGDGEQKKRLQKEISDLNLFGKVILRGRTTDVASVLSTATIYVMTSKFEGAPNSLMEAMAVGVPCISSNCPCGGPRMLINSGENGFLYELGNDAEFLKYLSLLADDEKIRFKVSSMAQKRAKQFNIESVYYEWLKYIEQI